MSIFKNLKRNVCRSPFPAIINVVGILFSISWVAQTLRKPDVQFN